MSALWAYPDISLPLTITQVSTYLKQYIEKGFAVVCVQGEISSCKQHTSGHTYFSLKDDQSVMDAICWRGTKTPIPLHDGALVICKGRITTYGARSKYQLIVESVESAGQGALLQKMEQLKIKLTQEGLFESHRKKPLPRFPETIGLITSATGAVIQDMLVRFSDRLPCRLLLYPVAVQGSNAVPDMLRALTFFHHYRIRPDVLIIARGGGSIEDLWAFHDESLVRAVAASTIPIISAIGHETDTTLVDYAADCRAPTPTAAAEMVLPLTTDMQEYILQCITTLRRALHHGYSLGRARLDTMIHRLYTFQSLIRPLEQRLDEAYDALIKGLSDAVVQSRHRWSLIVQKLGHGPIQRILSHQAHILRLDQDLKRLIGEKIDRLGMVVDRCEGALIQLSYQKTLERGFALILDPHQHICSSRALAVSKSQLVVQFHDGPLPVSVRGERD